MDWDDIEMIDEDNLNFGKYEDLLATYLEIGDRCIPIKHYDDGANLGLQIMDSPEKKKEFMDQYRYDLSLTFTNF